MKLKSFLISTGLACLISVPIVHYAQKSWYQTPNIQIEYSTELHDQAVENMEQIAEAERLRQELVAEEVRRQEEIDHAQQREIELEQLAEAFEVLETYQVNVPDDIRAYCEEAQEETNVCAELLEAVCWRESRFIPTAENAGCSGLMQVSTKWHKDRMKKLSVTDIYDPQGNIRVGADYLAELFKEHDGDLYKVLMEYNGDTSEGVSDYALEISEISAALERVHGK